jgi:hypothetical protein
MSDSNSWYQELCQTIRESVTECCGAHPESCGSCYEGCCDKWKCPECGKTWIQELGD